jgi:chromosomal replication initiator protein
MLWSECLQRLETQVSDSEISTWLHPLHALEKENGLFLLAPNTLVLQKVHENYVPLIIEHARALSGKPDYEILLQIGTDLSSIEDNKGTTKTDTKREKQRRKPSNNNNTVNYPQPSVERFTNNLNPKMTFENFVEGKSNQLARAASMQVGDNPGCSYNPMFIYGGVGLGKTHLMHAMGNRIRSLNPEAKVVYLHSEAFVNDMVMALRTNKIDKFKQYYRSVDALLLDDIQFFAGKERSLEEFFHTFNTLLEGQKQVILTSDRFPRDVPGIDDRLTSRFTSGLSVAIESPDLETRVAILRKKGEDAGLLIPNDVAFFIAQCFKSNIRDLEGALKKVIATVQFRNQSHISLAFVQETLRDQLASHVKTITIRNIKQTVAQYYNIRVSDLESKNRARFVTRPRQVAMSLAKELTSHSYPEIGLSFGGRDHTTVIHACKKVQELLRKESRLEEDMGILTRTLNN